MPLSPLGQVDKKTKNTLKKAFDAYEKTLLFTAERPESQLSLGIFYSNRKMFDKAKDAYLEAIRLQKKFVPTYVNYSHFLQNQGKEKEAFEILKKGMKNVPNMAMLYHSLGLWYVRNTMYEKAVLSLKKAVSLDPDNARFSYAYAVAIGEKEPQKAIEVLEAVYLKNRGDLQLVSGLAYYYKQVGERNKSTEFEKKLKALKNFSVH